jgi:steroid delta-isomerase-like uncharacterized protein
VTNLSCLKPACGQLAAALDADHKAQKVTVRKSEEEAMQQKGLVLGATLMLLGSLASAHGASPAADQAVLEHLLDLWASAWSSNDAGKLLPLFTEDVVYEDVTFGAVNKGSDNLRKFATGAFDSFADMTFELKTRFVSADGQRGAMEWVWRGRQTKDFPRLPATNKPFEVRGATVVEFREGKINRNYDYWDLATYMRQVGLAR